MMTMGLIWKNSSVRKRAGELRQAFDILLWKIIIESLKALRDFRKGEFRLEYAGELVNIKKAKVAKDLEQEAMNMSFITSDIMKTSTGVEF